MSRLGLRLRQRWQSCLKLLVCCKLISKSNWSLTTKCEVKEVDEMQTVFWNGLELLQLLLPVLYSRCVECRHRHEIRDVPALPVGNAFRETWVSKKAMSSAISAVLASSEVGNLGQIMGTTSFGGILWHGTWRWLLHFFYKNLGGKLRRKTPGTNIKVVIGPRILSLPNDNPRWLMLRGHRYCAGAGSWPKSLCCCQGCILLAICWVCWLSFLKKITVVWWVFNMFEPQEYGGIKDKDGRHPWNLKDDPNSKIE